MDNSKSKVLKNVKRLDEISNNWPKDLLGTNVYKTLECIVNAKVW